MDIAKKDDANSESGVLCTAFKSLACKKKKNCLFSWTVLGLLVVFLYYSFLVVTQHYQRYVFVDTPSTKEDNRLRDFSSTTHNHYVSSGVTDRMLNAIKKTGDCGKLENQPESWWRTTRTDDSFSAEADLARIQYAFGCGGQMFLPNYTTTPPIESMYSFEDEYLRYPPLTDMLDIISEAHSTIEVLNKSHTTYEVGDRVSVLILARDFRNMPRTRGGDEIRAWLTEVSNGLTNRVAAQVTDLKNGSYIVNALLPWAGKLSLSVALAYPSEHIRAMLQFHRTFKATLMMVGKFENKKASETTPCYHTPVIPGFSAVELCNLTSMNGSPWFCGRPLKKSLACEDYRYSRVVDQPDANPMFQTDAEYKLLKRPPQMRKIPSSIYFTVKPKSGRTSMATPIEMCHSIRPRQTWQTTTRPDGYTLEGKWVSLVCSGLAPTTGRECVKDKHVLFLGDSNARGVYDRFKQMVLSCIDLYPRLKEKWHRRLKCVSKSMNTVVEWVPHSQPFMSYQAMSLTLQINMETENHRENLIAIDRWSVKEDFASASQILDQAPFDSRTVWVILHHYVHITPFHLSVFEAKYRAMKDGVARLLQRLPHARVVIRGNHISWVEWARNHYRGGDHLGPFVSQIQRDVFHDLQDKVFFVPTWGQSIAIENKQLHPSFVGQVKDIIFQYLCDK